MHLPQVSYYKSKKKKYSGGVHLEKNNLITSASILSFFIIYFALYNVCQDLKNDIDVFIRLCEDWQLQTKYISLSLIDLLLKQVH